MASDLRVAFRTLARSPGFSGMTTVVLSLGVAAAAVMFGFLRITLQPPPLDGIDRVVSLAVEDTLHHQPERLPRLHDIEDWNVEQTSFEGAVAAMGPQMVAFRRQGAAAERCAAGLVTGPLFSVFRVRPLLGRTLTPEDARPGAAPVVVLSERLWRSTFRADPAALGELVRVNGEPYAVVGVAPAAFDLPVSAQLWVPDRTDTSFTPRLLAPQLLPVGRLRDGVSPEAARAELRAIQAGRVRRFPEVATERPEVRPFLWVGVEYQRLLRVLFGSVLLVLVLACVNAAGLLLVRGAGRTHEAAVRHALGAGRVRLACQMLAETAVIGGATTLVSLTVAEGSVEVMRRVVPVLLGSTPSWWRFALDGPTVLFALGTALAATLAAGLYPAVRAARVSVAPLLREGQRDTGLRAARLVRWLVVVEIALSTALLTAAGLVIRAGARLGRDDVGVPTAGMLIGVVELPRRYDLDEQRRFIRNLGWKLEAIPGTEGAAAATTLPGLSVTWRELYTLAEQEQPIEQLPSVAVIQVTPTFFEAFRIPILRGRGFLPIDAYRYGSLAVVSESFARATWPGQDPVGKQLRVAPQESWMPWVTVVGVARDVGYHEGLSKLGTTPPVVYTSLLQWPSRWLYLALREPRDPVSAAEGMRQAVRALDPDVPVSSFATLDQERLSSAATLTLVGRMSVAFGVVTLVLAATGVYGVLSYSVAQRARELAIRRALGASGGRIAMTVLARSAWQLLVGLALGLALEPVMGAVVGATVGGADSAWEVYLTVAGILVLTLVLALLIPVRRALSLPPSAALRQT